MLKVKTYLSESKIPGAGLGCFALEFIPKGTLIWEFDPQIDRRYTETDLLNMDQLSKDFIYKYAFKYRGQYFLCVDNGRFFNHSKNPNTLDPIDSNRTYSLVDIQIGEEILSDYGNFSDNPDDILFNTHL